MQSSRRYISVEHMGNIGNRVFQYLFACKIASLVPNLFPVNFNLLVFPIQSEVVRDFPGGKLRIEGNHLFDVARIAEMMRGRVAEHAVCRVFAQRLDYLPDPDQARQLLGVSEIRSYRQVPAEDLVVNVRGAEIMGGLHHDYFPLPIDYYRRLQSLTGRNLAFIGQIDDSLYCTALRNAFPKASFWPSTGAWEDFGILINAEYIACSISTFSWLAAWLSPAAKQIFLPVGGLFNPNQRPDVYLMPIMDSRYRFFPFPLMKWKGSEDQLIGLTNREYLGEELNIAVTKSIISSNSLKDLAYGRLSILLSGEANA